jgi:hypothetical protein
MCSDGRLLVWTNNDTYLRVDLVLNDFDEKMDRNCSFEASIDSNMLDRESQRMTHSYFNNPPPRSLIFLFNPT